jgi:glycosyltransferase involved in cell wall biosynthesis
VKLIFLSSLVPVKDPKSGYDIANRVIVDGLYALGIDLKIMGFLTPGEEPAYPDATIVLGELEVTNTKVSKLQKARWLMKAVAEGMTVSSAKMLAVDADVIRSNLDGLRPFDGLILNSVQLAGAFFEIFSKEKTIFIAHNVESASAIKNATAAANGVSAFLFKREATLLDRLETELCAQASHVWTLADQDRIDLNITQKSNMLPLVTSIKPVVRPANQHVIYDIGTIGSWSWAANRQGLDWFLSKIVPKLPNQYTIAIAGNIGNIRSDVPDNVKFLGRVEDAREFCRRCAVIPLFSQEGTGVQLKTIETFELGLPAVATQNALRGISDIPENCFKVEDPYQFADALIDCVERTKGGVNLHIDGNEFHQRQLDALMSNLSVGLKAANFLHDVKEGAL